MCATAPALPCPASLLPLPPFCHPLYTLPAGYFWFQAGCFYFGGKVWESPGENNRVYYNSGRNEFTTM